MLHLGIDFIEGNAMKNSLCLIFSFVLLSLFAFDDDVNCSVGVLLALGSSFGGYVGSKFASKESSRIWAFALLIALLSLEILMLIIKSLCPIQKAITKSALRIQGIQLWEIDWKESIGSECRKYLMQGMSFEYLY